MTVGRIEPEKGHTFLLDALSLLRNGDIRCFLGIVGTGSAESNVRRYAKDNGLSDHIEFTGYVPFGPQLESIYRGSDIFVLPSLGEGFPRVIVEALAYGLPVVATKVGGIPYLLRDGHDALLVDPGSPRQLAEAIQRLKDDGLRNRLINNGFNTALGMTAESQQELVYNSIISQYPHLAR
jgi:glycosyltransferase involved in cell wall biosynthesis